MVDDASIKLLSGFARAETLSGRLPRHALDFDVARMAVDAAVLAAARVQVRDAAAPNLPAEKHDLFAQRAEPFGHWDQRRSVGRRHRD